MHFSDVIERHSRSMKMLSMKRPRPSIEITTPAVTSLLVKASAVKVDCPGRPSVCQAAIRVALISLRR